MIESASLRICIWDNLPIEESPIFKTLAEENGVKFANRHTRQIKIDLHPPPEVQTHDRSIDMDMGRTRQYQFYSRGGVSSQTGNPVSIQTSEAG